MHEEKKYYNHSVYCLYQYGYIFKFPINDLLRSEEGDAGYEERGGEHPNLFDLSVLQVTRKRQIHKLRIIRQKSRLSDVHNLDKIHVHLQLPVVAVFFSQKTLPQLQVSMVWQCFSTEKHCHTPQNDGPNPLNARQWTKPRCWRPQKPLALCFYVLKVIPANQRRVSSLVSRLYIRMV